VPGLPLLDKRLLVVTGKGGVGKSTVSAALALLASRRGKRVLVCEVNAQESVAPMLGAPPSGSVAREVLPGLSTINVTPAEAMREYGLAVVKFRTIYDAVFENRAVRYFLRVIPALTELVLLGKILNETRAQEGGRWRWDLVIMDAPATGHAVQLLRVPAALIDTVPAGPLRRDAEWMRDLLVDPAWSSLSIVTLPEEMPVNEAIEFDAQARGILGIPRGVLFVNAMLENRFADAERAELDRLEGAAPPLGPAVRAARLYGARAQQSVRCAERARSAFDLPVVDLPLLVEQPWGSAAIERIAAAISGAGL
jgi:anion-transporting  ArsA/GET3 family ATPase